MNHACVCMYWREITETSVYVYSQLQKKLLFLTLDTCDSHLSKMRVPRDNTYVYFADSKMLCLRDMVLFACHDGRWLGSLSLSPRNTPMVLDTAANDIAYEPLARSDDYLKFNSLNGFCAWWLRIADSWHQHVIWQMLACFQVRATELQWTYYMHSSCYSNSKLHNCMLATSSSVLYHSAS